MATFNAGSIDATLTLDRSAFTRELREARARADAFEANPITINLNLDAGDTQARLDEIRASVRDMRATVEINLDAGPTVAEMAGLDEIVNRLDGRVINLRVDADVVNALKLLAIVEASIDVLDGDTVNINVNADTLIALEQLALVESAVEVLDGDTIKLQVNVDSAAAEVQLALLEAANTALDGDAIAIQVDVDSGAAEVQLALLEGQMALLDENLNISVDADFADAFGQLALFDVALGSVDGDTINIPVDVDAGAAEIELAVLAAEVTVLDGKDIDITVDVDKDGKGAKSAAGIAGSIGKTEALITAVILLAPLIPAALAPAAVVIGGIAAGLVAAAAGIAILALGLGGVFLTYQQMQKNMKAANKELGKVTDNLDKQKEKLAGMKPGTDKYKAQLKVVQDATKDYDDQLKATNETHDKFTGKFGTVVSSVEHLKGAWANFQKAISPVAIGLITRVLDLFVMILPKLSPIFNAFGDIASGALKSIGDFISGPEGTRMFTFFKDIGAASFKELLRGLGNLVLIFGRLFEAFGPIGVQMLSALADGLGKIADNVDGLASKKGFQDFLAYAAEMGPRIVTMFKALWDALVNIGLALAPLAGPLITGITAFFGFIANMPTGTLTTLILLFGGLFLAIQGITLIGQAWKATVAAIETAQALWATATGIMAAVTGGLSTAWTVLNAVIAANPIVFVVLAIVALIAIVILAYKHSETFRNIVDGAFRAVKTAVEVMWNAIKIAFTFIIDKMTAVGDWIRARVADIISFFVNLPGQITGAFGDGFSWLRNKALAVANWVIDKITDLVTFFTGLPGKVSTAFGNGFKWLVDKAITLVTDIGAEIAKIIAFYTSLPGKLATAAGDVFHFLVTKAKTLVTDLGAEILNIITFFTNLPDKIISALGNLGDMLKNAGKAIIQGLIDGMEFMLDGIRKTMGKVTGIIGKFIPGSPVREGPLKVLNDGHAGRQIVRMLADGIIGSSDLVSSAFNSVGLGGTGTLTLAAQGGAGTTATLGSGGSAGIDLTSLELQQRRTNDILEAALGTRLDRIADLLDVGAPLVEVGV